MPDCEVLLSELDVATDAYLTARDAYWAKREELQATGSEFQSRVEEIDLQLDDLEEEEQALLTEKEALGDYDPEQTECGDYNTAWTEADRELGEANSAWNIAYARYELATEEYERLSAEWSEIYDHLTGARDRLEEVQARIGELEPHETDDTSVPELEELRAEEEALEEEIALLEPMEAAAFAAAEAADRESAELMQPLDELEANAIQAEEAEREAWDAWQACLENAPKAIRGAEIDSRLEAIDTERAQLLNQRETQSAGAQEYSMFGSKWQEENAQAQVPYDEAITKMFEAFNAAKAHGCIEGEAGEYRDEYDNPD